jgi:hypothetical protein
MIATAAYWLFSDTDVSFESSDGRWALAEWHAKGIDFEGVVASFELYKITCEAASASLFRTTRKHWYYIFAWPSYLRWNEPKWKVPYAVPNHTASEYYRSASIAHCTGNSTLIGTLEQARMNAKAYIDHLSSSGA